MLIAILLFAIPRRLSLNAPPLLQWRQCEGRLSWGTVMLLGGGYAMAAAVSVRLNIHCFKVKALFYFVGLLRISYANSI